MSDLLKEYVKSPGELLKSFGVQVRLLDDHLIYFAGSSFVKFRIVSEISAPQSSAFFFVDQILYRKEKVGAIVISKLGLNSKIFARNCTYTPIGRTDGAAFFDQYHLISDVKASYYRALIDKSERLLAVASFSKGRRMDRLREHERSFELYRFCCLPGISLIGGLSKLVKNFCLEKKAGDIMSYVDLQLGDGSSFASAGFVKNGLSEPTCFLVDRESHLRRVYRGESFDTKKLYKVCNSGNIKMLFSCHMSER